PITALGALSVKTFKDFSFGMAQVRAISGATVEEFESLRKSALALGAATAFSASDVAELQLNLSKLGFDPSQINDATDGILDLALAMGEDLAQSAEVAAATIQGFGLDASETNRVTDVMAKSFSSSALDLQKFSIAMSKVAPVAKNANVSLEESTALLSVLANSGLEASVAGTAVRNVFLRLSQSGMTFGKAMEIISSSSNKSATAMEFFGIQGATAATILADNTELAAQLTESYNNAEGAAKSMADMMNDTLWGAFQNLQSATEALMITIGEHLAPAIRKVADTISKLSNFLNDLPAPIQKAAIAIGAVVAAAGPLLLALGGIMTLIPAIVTGLSTLGAAFTVLTGPIGLTVAAIVGIGVAVVKNWDKIKPYIIDSINWF